MPSKNAVFVTKTNSNPKVSARALSTKLLWVEQSVRTKPLLPTLQCDAELAGDPDTFLAWHWLRPVQHVMVEDHGVAGVEFGSQVKITLEPLVDPFIGTHVRNQL